MHRTVIDEDLIIECIKESRQSEQEAKDEDNNQSTNVKVSAAEDDGLGSALHQKGQSVSKGEMDFTTIGELSLSFRDIYKIDHLRGFESLVRLRLDNNLIESIENLGHLVNLEWLDLSFNNISRIEGLEELHKLTDLCLVNNFITQIENLDGCPSLQVLSLGNNCIESIEDNILYLRRFANLQALNLKGNPVYDEHDFKVSIFAYCANLKFLDYERVKPQDLAHAKHEKQRQLCEIEESEEQSRKRNQSERDEHKLNALLDAANIEGVHSMFDDMIRDDSEMIRLRNLPGFAQEIDAYKVALEALTQKYIADVVAVHGEKQTEDAILQRTLKKVSFESETHSIARIDAFEAQLSELEADEQKSKKAALKRISDVLMESEMQCVEKINFIVNVFEDRITELMKKNLNNAEHYFADVSNLENEYHQHLLDRIGAILEAIKRDGIDSVIPALPENESLRNMIADKDAINNSISLSHDNHISHIGRLEDLVRDREEKERKEKMKQQNDAQYKRNRQRISEIIIFVDKCAKQLGNVKMD